jgi:hypothetical protein
MGQIMHRFLRESKWMSITEEQAGYIVSNHWGSLTVAMDLMQALERGATVFIPVRTCHTSKEGVRVLRRA